MLLRGQGEGRRRRTRAGYFYDVWHGLRMSKFPNFGRTLMSKQSLRMFWSRKLPQSSRETLPKFGDTLSRNRVQTAKTPFWVKSVKHHLRSALCSFKNHKKLAVGRIRTIDLSHSSLTLCRCAILELIHDLEKHFRTRRRREFVGGVWSRSLESLLCELWGNFGGILEHGSIHLSARAVAERYFFGKFPPKVPPKSGSGRVGRTKTVPDFRVQDIFLLSSLSLSLSLSLSFSLSLCII